MMRIAFLLFAMGCGVDEPAGIDPLDDAERMDPKAMNTIGGKEIPVEPGRTNDTVRDPPREVVVEAETTAAAQPRGPIISGPQDGGDLPGVRGRTRARTPDEIIAEFTASGKRPGNAVLERRLAQQFMDEEFDEAKFQEMKAMKEVDIAPDPHKYDDPRNYSENQARKKRLGR